MLKKLILSLLLIPSVALAQQSLYLDDFRRNDDAAIATGQPNTAPVRASTTKYGEMFVQPRRGNNLCSIGAETGTAIKNITIPVSSLSWYISRVNCYNNSANASVISLYNGLTKVSEDYIGNTTLGNNRVRFDFINPIIVLPNTALNFVMGTTATSTICCANYELHQG